jgi:hypothetical protein
LGKILDEKGQDDLNRLEKLNFSIRFYDFKVEMKNKAPQSDESKKEAGRIN